MKKARDSSQITRVYLKQVPELTRVVNGEGTVTGNSEDGFRQDDV